MIVAIRGAITAKENTKDEILSVTEQMLSEILSRNNLTEDNLISLVFTVTPDLNQAFPATAARKLGLTKTPLMCATEIPVPNSLPMCVRVLIHCDTHLRKNEVQHVYLGGAVALRTDLVKDE